MNITPTILAEGEKLGYIVPADQFENEAHAETYGFYWFDEIDRWVNINAALADMEGIS